jgi:hypothetical protein
MSARPTPPGVEHLPWGFVPLRDVSDRCPLTAGFPYPLCSVLAVSHDLDGFLHLSPCGFISLRCHVRDSLSRGFPSRPAVQAFTCRCPLAVDAAPLRSANRSRQETTLAYRAFLRARVRGDPQRFRLRAVRSPPELSPSSGPSPHTLPAASRRLRPRPFTALDVSRCVQPANLLRDQLPRSRFVACSPSPKR